jgi:alpha-tubulin suppressor-like RCC1 family protein
VRATAAVEASGRKGAAGDGIRGSSRADCDAVVSWGRGEDGQLGHGNAEECQEPRVVHALVDAGVSQVCCGAEYSVAVSSSQREVYSWGW